MIFGVPFIVFVFYYLIGVVMVEVALLTVGNTIVALLIKVIRAAMREGVKSYIAYEQYKLKLYTEPQEGVNDASTEEGRRSPDSVGTSEVRKD